MTTKLEFLQEHPIFANLDDGDLLDLSRIAREYEFDADALIAYQRDLAVSMILVMDGRLYAREVDPQGLVREENTQAYEKGDHLGATSLFRPEKHLATVEATHAGRYIEIPGEAFRAFLLSRPRVFERLKPILNEELEWKGGLPEPAWELAKQLMIAGSEIQADQPASERLIYETRQSRLYLLWRVSLACIIFAIAALVMLAALIPGISLEPQILWVVLSGLALLITGAKIAYEIYDWYKDVFKVTNLHITLDEFDFGSFTTLMIKVPINQVQTVSILKPSIMANILKLGGIGITTASSVGDVKFDHIRSPGEVMEYISKAVEESHAAQDAATQTVMRKTVSEYFDIEPDIQSIDADDEITETFSTTKKRRGLFTWPFRMRIVEGQTVTYHRNVFVLLRSLIKPILMTLVIIAAGILFRDLLSNGFILAIFLFAIIVNIVWYLYEIIDWNNDIFKVTEQVIIDEDRSPFFSRVSRKQAPLANVQNVTVNKEGIRAAIFNYGSVRIETAGSASDIVFENIHNPNQALYDIFLRLDRLRESNLDKDGQQRREEYAVLLDVYQQEIERDRIPRRLPED